MTEEPTADDPENTDWGGTLAPPGPHDHVTGPAFRGGDVWILQDDEDPTLWHITWIDGPNTASNFDGPEDSAFAWANARPADRWFIFDSVLDDWVTYTPTP